MAIVATKNSILVAIMHNLILTANGFLFVLGNCVALDFEDERIEFCNSEMHVDAVLSDKQDFKRLYLFNGNLLWIVAVNTEKGSITLTDVMMVKNKFPQLTTVNGACFLNLKRWEKHIFVQGHRMIVMEKSGKIDLNSTDYINHKGYKLRKGDQIKCFGCPCPPDRECYGIVVIHRPPASAVTLRCSITHDDSGFVDLGACAVAQDEPEILPARPKDAHLCEAMTYTYTDGSPLLIYIDAYNFNIYRGSGQMTVTVSKADVFSCKRPLAVLIILLMSLTIIAVIVVVMVVVFMLLAKRNEPEHMATKTTGKTHTKGEAARPASLLRW